MPIQTKTRRFLLRIRRFRRAEKGATAVEFAMVSVPFFALLFAILELGITFLYGQVMQSGVQAASRLVLTGQVAKTPGPPAAKVARFQTELCNQIGWLISCPASVKYESYSSPASMPNPPLPVAGGILLTPAPPSFGNPGEYVMIRAHYLLPVYTSFLGEGLGSMMGNKRLITGVAAFRNEPW